MGHRLCLLTNREREVLSLIAEGNTTRQIARHLGISFKTACCHRAHVLEKLGARKSIEAVRTAVAQGLIERPWGTELGVSPELSARADMALISFRDHRQKLSEALQEFGALRKRTKGLREDLRALRHETQRRLSDCRKATA
jgi:DNA-binding CsgD family transcriptional regulator